MTEDLLADLSETLARANGLLNDFSFEQEGIRREGARGIAQLVELAQLLAERALNSTTGGTIAGT